MFDDVLRQEAYDSYRFLIDHTNFEEGSPGYGLTYDRSSHRNEATIAGSGFMLTGLVIGVVQKWDSYETNLRRAKLTLKNFYENIPQKYGLFVHYVEYNTGLRYKTSEYSTIDTTILVNGMLTVDSFFDDDEIHYYTKKIYERIDWKKMIFERHNRKVLRMAYNDILGGAYLKKGQLGWIHHWSMAAEQLTIYLLAAGSNISTVTAKELFLGFERSVGGYQDHHFIYTPCGSLFVYLFSNAWFDFRKYNDTTGYNWFKNSTEGILGNYKYCQNKKRFKTFKAGFWGLSACDGPEGYKVYGAPPLTTYESLTKKRRKQHNDGTIALYAILASLPFVPEIVKETCGILEKYPDLKGKYGYYESINLEEDLWVGTDYLSINKGITLLMIDNYYSGTTWEYYTKHPIIQKAITKLAFRKR